MTDVDQRVLAETLRLEAAMPSLLKGHAGKWVVFRAAHSLSCGVIAQVVERGAHTLSRAAHRIIQS